ncbi:hypothetical protein yberc0001_36140 [Yersinia bercovieri ATCC 43970]|uniref:Uncharacterized protein n=1 Tax=Yersinia bercovieri ATCC 43970 TaxID=349968 RepID=A0ABP2E026_YERBE|nr:hypothetical protein [Yersinia bercovieri]EEQ05829.1 hypothetical protein yberc0001_36140 [Yersinia bercovieri ATCC 43970]
MQIDNALTDKILNLAQNGIVQITDLHHYDKDTVLFHFDHLCAQGWAEPRPVRNDRDGIYGFMLQGITTEGRRKLHIKNHQEHTETPAALLENCTINGGLVQIQVGGGNNQTGAYTAQSDGGRLLIWAKRVWGWVKRWWGGS